MAPVTAYCLVPVGFFSCSRLTDVEIACRPRCGCVAAGSSLISRPVNSDRRGVEASRVDEALGRFETAMRQLEAALAQLHEQQAQRIRGAGDAAALRADRLRLVQELAEVRAKASELAEQQRRASRRIDQAMARIRRVLGE
jgi:Domain of unknown function (DUF4164)